MAAKKAYGIVLDNVHLIPPKPFLGGHDKEMVKAFVNALDMYFQLTRITDDNTKALFAKTQFNLLA